MKKIPKFLPILLFSTIFLSLSAGFCYAVVLEVAYPTLSSGANITASSTVPEYLKYIFDFGMFMGFFTVFLSLTYAGVLYFLSPAIPSALARAKDRISGSISGLIILILTYLIITAINPALSIFKTPELQNLPPSTMSPNTGVNLYKLSSCQLGGSGNPCSASNTTCPSGETCDLSTLTCKEANPLLYTNSIPDLAEKDLSKRIKSVKITNDPTENIYYFANLYENPKFRGKCLLIPYNVGCKETPTPPWASSVDIFRQSLSASGDITIYRNASFNAPGGYFTVKGSDVQASINSGSAYKIDLNNTYFGPSSDPDGCTVPEIEQNCIKYDKIGSCIQRQCPTLAEKNIGSIKIQGDYFVLALYFSPTDDESGPWTNCQSFATLDDINKDGPRQIKWEDITNKNSFMLPNWIIIFPIQK